MGATYMTDPIIFLIDTVCSLYIMAILLRFLLQWCAADFYNPICQFLVKITHPPLRIMRRFVPSIGKIDSSSLVLMLSLQMLTDFSILLLKGVTINIGALAILSMPQLGSLLLNVLVFSVFARALLSWMNPGSFYAAASMVDALSRPILNLCRKMIPDLGGIDLSPLAALLFLQMAKMVVLPPLHELASILG